MATSSVPTYDPKSTATNLTKALFDEPMSTVAAQISLANATTSELTKIGSAMSTFQSALDALSDKKSVLANSASFSADVGTVSANSSATPGTYSFYVERLATAGQVSYAGISDTTTAASAGNLAVTLADGTNFNVTLSNADKNLDGKLSAKEIAAAINVAAGNDSRVVASTLTVNGQTSLVLTSAKTGLANDVSLDASGVADPALKSALGIGNQKRLTAADDAVVYFGGDQATGIKIQQASNTFTAIDGVTATFTKTTTSTVNLTVAKDNAGTAANVQGFVDAFNKLQALLKSETKNGNAADGSDGSQPGLFASDSGLNALRARMTSILHQGSGGVSLASYGVTLQRDGSLALDATRLNKALAANPSGLDAVFGSTSASAPSGVLGAMDKLLGQWTNSATGQISQRRDSSGKSLVALSARDTKLKADYDVTYNRYLAQFTQLQALQAQMSQTGSLFDNLFSKDS